MLDCFALLNETRRPWLDVDLLKQKFFALSANLHPDRIHSASESDKVAATKKFTELNAAYLCLTEPKLRLLHLLELELGAKPKDIQQIPAALADLFAEVANNCRNANSFLAEKNKVRSACSTCSNLNSARSQRTFSRFPLHLPICLPKLRTTAGTRTVFSLKKTRPRRRWCKSSCSSADTIGSRN